MPRQTTAPRFLRLPEVLQITGMGKTFIYDRMRDGTFPKQIQLGSPFSGLERAEVAFTRKPAMLK